MCRHECGSGLTREALAYAACRGGWPASVVKAGEAALSTTRRIVRKALREAAARAAKHPPAEEALRGASPRRGPPRGDDGPRHEASQGACGRAGVAPLLPGGPQGAPRHLRDGRLGRLDGAAPLGGAASHDARAEFLRSLVRLGRARARAGEAASRPDGFRRCSGNFACGTFGVFADLLEGGLAHWRDRVGRASLVVTTWDGRYGLVAVSPGGGRAEERNAGMLRAMAAKINVERRGAPSFLMVLTADGWGPGVAKTVFGSCRSGVSDPE